MKIVLAGLCASSLLFGGNQIQGYLDTLKSEVLKEEPTFKGFDASRGEKIFTSKQTNKDGKEIACITCHTSNLKAQGENVKTGKKIEPLAVSANPKSLSDEKNVKKWLKRNFNDVYSREGSAKEKGDVLTFILSK